MQPSGHTKSVFPQAWLCTPLQFFRHAAPLGQLDPLRQLVEAAYHGLPDLLYQHIDVHLLP